MTRENGDLTQASVGYWAAAKNRVVNTAVEPSLLVPEPSWQVVGESVRRSVDLVQFSPKKGQSFSLLRDVLRVLQVEMVFRIHRTDRQWELPE